MTAHSTGTLGALHRGVTAFFLSLPSTVAAGLVVFAPLGMEAVPAGVVASLVGAAIGGMVMALASSARAMIVAPASSIAVLTSGILAAFVQRGDLHPGDVAGAIAVVALLAIGSGVFQLLIGASGLGRFVQLLPYPVVAGLTNTTATLLLLGQLPVALGLSAGAGLSPGAILVAGVTLAVALRRIPVPVPAPVLAVSVGVAVHYLVLPHLGLGPAGQVLGSTETLWAHLNHMPQVAERARAIDPRTLLLGALSLALLVSLEAMVLVAALGDRGAPPSSSRRDLMALGAVNIMCGALGAMPCSGTSSTTLSMWGAGNRGAGAGFVRSLILLALLSLPFPTLGLLPRPMLAGLVLAAAWRLIDTEIFRLLRHTGRAGLRRRGEMLGNAGIVVLVTAVGATKGLVAAVMVGLVLALLLFASAMSQGVLRRRVRNPVGRSRTRRGAAQSAALLAHGDRIEVLEIEGAVFFGSVDRVALAVDAALHGGARQVVLDMSQVDRIDLSGARRLLQMCERFWRKDVWLVVAPVRPGRAVHDYLADLGLLGRFQAWGLASSMEDALARAEDRVLADLGASDPEAAIDATTALTQIGLPEDATAAILSVAGIVSLPAEAVLMAQGDPADSVFLLLSGQLDISVALRPDHDGPVVRTRLATLAPGALVGEMALLSGAPRSADVTTRGAVTCLRLDHAAIAALRLDAPDAAYALLAAIARAIEQNLRLANAAIAALEV